MARIGRKEAPRHAVHQGKGETTAMLGRIEAEREFFITSNCHRPDSRGVSGHLLVGIEVH